MPVTKKSLNIFLTISITMSLEGEGKVHKIDGKCMIYVPIKVSSDSRFPFKDKDVVKIKIVKNKLVIEK